MKRWSALLCMILGCAAAAAAQDLRPIGSDLSTLLQGVGQSVIENLQQSVLADNGVGAASLGSSRFYVGITLGATLSHGLLGFVNTPNEFQVLNVNGLITNNLPGSLSGLYTTAQTFFPDPNLKLTFGLRPVAGIEVLGTFSILPDALTNTITKAAKVSGTTLNSLSAGLLVRKVFMEDTGPFPAVSLGVGYTYANFNAGYSINNFSQGFGGDTLTLGGNLKLGWTLNTAGIELDISKRLLVFVPYLKIIPWYQWASFSGSIDNFTADLSSGGTPITPTYGAGSPSATITQNDIGFLLDAGVEVALGGFRLVPSGSYDILTNTFSANLSARGQF